MDGHVHLVGISIACKWQAHVFPVTDMAAKNFSVTQACVEHKWCWNLTDKAHFFAFIVGIKKPVGYMKTRLSTNFVSGIWGVS